MAKNNVIELAGRDTIVDPLTDLLRTGAEKLIYQGEYNKPGLKRFWPTHDGIGGWIGPSIGCLKFNNDYTAKLRTLEQG